jgi:hypothetical protein
MDRSWYDTAQVCLNGHVVNDSVKASPEFNQKYCDKCGQPTITECQNCNHPIRGYYHSPGVIYPSTREPPSFCHECGKPYPWTATKLEAAQELADELENLTQEEKDILKKSLDDLVRDSPKTTVAATRFKKLVRKAGGEATGSFKQILIGVVTEAAKKLLWPS